MSNGPTKAEEKQREWEISTREYFERLLSEKDKFWEMKFRTQEIYYNAKLEAIEKATSAAFAASEKAIVKTDDAQKAYNATHNDLSRKMEGQYAAMVPRTEWKQRNDTVDEKFNEVKKDVASLRESRSEGGGKSIGLDKGWGYALAVVMLILALAAALLRN